MAKKEEGKTYWMTTEVGEELHTAMLEISMMMGKHPRFVLEIAAEQFVINWTAEREAKGKEVPKLVKLESILIEERRSQLRINQVKSMAYSHVQNPSDESAEQLASACDLVGVSMEYILEQVSANPHIADIMSDGKSLTSVESFLVDYIRPGKAYLANDVMAAGEEVGFKPYLIKEAKRKLGIASKRDKNNWVWFFPDKQKQPTEDAESIF